jgi:hypothetical protein|tara:strand:- start:1513 stop:1638 length:126 start_codon:yes stop_codon:yes gene_type:complete
MDEEKVDLSLIETQLTELVQLMNQVVAELSTLSTNVSEISD